MMKPGDTPVIEYLSGTGERWTASLTDLSGAFPAGVSDPDFVHTGPGGQSHHDQWINYIAWDGSIWWSKCHSHSSTFGSSKISFTFEHFHNPDGDPDHEDATLGFLSWDRSRWLATVPDKTGLSDVHFDVTQH